MQDVDRSEPLAGDSLRVVTRRQAVTLHVAVGVLSVAVCMLAAFLASMGYEVYMSVYHSALHPPWKETSQPWAPTPGFQGYALALGGILGAATSMVWCRRALAHHNRPVSKLKPVRLAILLALGATLLLHPALGSLQGFIRGVPIPWDVVIGLTLFYGIASALILGSIAGSIAYHWIAAYILGLDET